MHTLKNLFGVIKLQNLKLLLHFFQTIHSFLSALDEHLIITLISKIHFICDIKASHGITHINVAFKPKVTLMISVEKKMNDLKTTLFSQKVSEKANYTSIIKYNYAGKLCK